MFFMPALGVYTIYCGWLLFNKIVSRGAEWKLDEKEQEKQDWEND